MNSGNRIKLVRIASLISLIGNIIICIAKLVIGIYANSLSVIGDGIDSATDVSISIMTLAVSFIIGRPSDKKHPWGHQRAETMASLILAFIIMIAGFQLFITATGKLINVYKGTVTILMPHILAVIVTVSSIAVKLLLALNQYIIGKKTGSMMIQANAKNMTNDVILSASVLAGLAISRFFKAPITSKTEAASIRRSVMTEARNNPFIPSPIAGSMKSSGTNRIRERHKVSIAALLASFTAWKNVMERIMIPYVM